MSDLDGFHSGIGGEYRAHVSHDHARFGIALTLINRRGERISLGQPTDITFQDTDPGIYMPEPTMRIPDSLGRALLDALTAHYGGATDTRTLRKDYEAERARVDRLIGMIGPQP